MSPQDNDKGSHVVAETVSHTREERNGLKNTRVKSNGSVLLPQKKRKKEKERQNSHREGQGGTRDSTRGPRMAPAAIRTDMSVYNALGEREKSQNVEMEKKKSHRHTETQ